MARATRESCRILLPFALALALLLTLSEVCRYLPHSPCQPLKVSQRGVDGLIVTGMHACWGSFAKELQHAPAFSFIFTIMYGCRPALLLVGDVTVDVVDGKKAVVGTCSL